MFQDLKTNFKKLFKGRQGTSSPRLGADPSGDWRKIFIVFSIINLLILLWSGYLFWQINQGAIFKVAPPDGAAAEAATKSKLLETINTYDAKEKKFEEIRDTPPVALDPSL